MTRARGQLRIVGGAWRSRRLRVPDEPGVRPTPDRVRETLFNWLGPWIEGKRVLDLFAGSGALGLEALSRGAASAVLLESSHPAIEAIEANIAALGADTASLVCMDARGYLQRTGERFDLVFIDPPYASGLASLALERVRGERWLNPGGFVYVEVSAQSASQPLDETLAGHWQVHRALKAGAVHGRLLQRAEGA